MQDTTEVLGGKKAGTLTAARKFLFVCFELYTQNEYYFLETLSIIR